MQRQLDVHVLRSLIAIVDTGGFGKAAQALSITQPAVSQHVRRMERLLKGPVFTQTGQNLRLSPKGEELLSYARRLVALHDEALSHFEQTQHRPVFSLGVSHQLTGALRNVLSGFRGYAPDSRVIVQTGLSEPLAHRVGAGALDLGLLCGAAEPSDAELLGHTPFGWFGSLGADHDGPVPLVVPSTRSCVRRQLLEALDAAGRRWYIACESEDPNVLRMAVEAGMGLSWMALGAGQAWDLPPAVLPNLPKPAPSPVWLVRSPGLSEQSVTGVTSVLTSALLRAGFLHHRPERICSPLRERLLEYVGEGRAA